MNRAPLGNSDGATNPEVRSMPIWGQRSLTIFASDKPTRLGIVTSVKECPNVGVHLQDCECLLAIASFEDAVARFAQHVIRQKPDKGFVFDNENYNGSGVIRVAHYKFL